MFFILFIYGTFLTSISIDYVASSGCESFNNVNMLLFDKTGRKFSQDVNGCITRTEFGNTTVVAVHVRDQIIPKLGRDAVKHMKHLKKLSIRNCGMEEIIPVAFRNVPKLNIIELAYGKLKVIPKGVFNYESTPQLEHLKMEYNEINSIEDQSFYNISSLKNFQLNHNNLELWRREWFENSTNLEIINLSFNKIGEIPTKAFISFINLKTINFDHNDITKIELDAFKGIRTLSYLGLGYNKLTVLSDISFPNTIRIDYFAINANFFTFLSNKVLKKLAAFQVAMDYNPWTCPCLDRINYWLYIKNGKVKSLDECSGSHIPVCVVPNNTQDCFDGFDHEAMLRYINIIKTINISTPIPSSCINFQ